MSRVPDLAEAEMSDRQRSLYAAIKGPRGIVAGPFALWLRLPDVADSANQFGNALRLHGALDRRIFELLVLVIARHWTAQYEWYQHEPAALKAGLDATIVEAIRNGTPPPFQHEDERVAFDVVTELQTSKRLSDATYARAAAQFGVDVLIEAITAIGFYTTAAMMINAFDAPVPGDARPLPDLGAQHA